MLNGLYYKVIISATKAKDMAGVLPMGVDMAGETERVNTRITHG